MFGMGHIANDLQWQMIGQTNYTTDIAVAANDTAIRVVYTERNSTAAMNENDRYTVAGVQYIASNDWGKT